MQLSDIPTAFIVPWANAAGPSFVRPIPVASQIGIQVSGEPLLTPRSAT